MRENRFIEQNKAKWEACENLLQAKRPDPDRLSRMFMEVNDDLAFARTFFPNRQIRVYLNQLALQLYSRFQDHESKQKRPFRQFWLETLPLTVYQSRKALWVSLLTLLLAVGIGMLSYSQNPAFASIVLGDAYVEMTERNIESGDPMKVYKEAQPTNMFLAITLNNLRVALLTFVSGALFGLGALAVLLSNGIMLGTFHYFFVEKGVFGQAFLTIWQHGSLEISSMVIAGGAGLVMGQGLLFPGTYKRLQAFRMTALRGLKLFAGTIPLFIMAGFIEGFITRFTGLPDGILMGTILLSLFFVFAYFVWYPYKVAAAKGFPQVTETYRVPAKPPYRIRFYGLKSVGEVFTDTIQYGKQHGTFLAKLAVGLAVAQVLCIWFIWQPLANPGGELIDKAYSLWYLSHLQTPSFLPLAFTGLFVAAWLTHAHLLRYLGGHQSVPSLWQVSRSYSGGYLVLTLLSMALLLIGEGWGYVLFLLSLPFAGISLFSGMHDREDVFHGMGQFIRFLGNGKTKILFFFFIHVLAGAVVYFIVTTPLAFFYTRLLAWNIPADTEWGTALLDMLLLGIRIVVFNLFFIMGWLGYGILSGALKEQTDAPAFFQEIQTWKA